VTIAALRLAIERAPDATGTSNPSYHLGLAADNVAPAANLLALINTQGVQPRVIDMLNADITVDFSAPWDHFAIESARPQPTRVEVTRLAATWGAMTLEASGNLDVDARGIPSGVITANARNWENMLALAAGAGVLTSDAATMAKRALGMIAGGAGNAKTLEIPLRFEAGRVWLGPLPIADAPVLQLR
jgi:hypothetical protein